MAKKNNSPWACGAEMEEKLLGKEAHARMLATVFGAQIKEKYFPNQPNPSSPWATPPSEKQQEPRKKITPSNPPSPWGWDV